MYFDRKGIGGIDAKPTARVAVATNGLPAIADRSKGMWRRIILLPFRVTIPAAEQDRELGRKLKTELPGILTWAFDGRRRLHQQGRFTASGVSDAAVEEYRAESNTAAEFLREQYHFDGETQMPVDCVYQGYRVWAKENGHVALNHAQFGKEVVKVYPMLKRVRPSLPDGSRPRMYQGLGIGVESEPAELKIAA